MMTQAQPSFSQAAEDYGRIEEAIRYIEANQKAQPTLEQIAAHVGRSEAHFQRMFTRWAGVSPKRFLQYLTMQPAKQLLAASKSVLDATYEAGLSSPGRLHDLFVTYESMTPGDYKKLGSGLTIRYGFHETPFGEAVCAVTERGICGLQFVEDGDQTAALASIQANWPKATFVADPAVTEPLMTQIFGDEPPSQKLPVLLKGTPFQLQVWQALLKVPAGAVVSYGDIAKLIRRETAVRAVGSAIGRNNIAYLIPCHRVIREVGGMGGYRWGTVRKRAMLGREVAHA
mgnify:CR=1 FL=1